MAVSISRITKIDQSTLYFRYGSFVFRSPRRDLDPHCDLRTIPEASPPGRANSGSSLLRFLVAPDYARDPFIHSPSRLVYDRLPQIQRHDHPAIPQIEV